jgi:hypothetical protein
MMQDRAPRGTTAQPDLPARRFSSRALISGSELGPGPGPRPDSPADVVDGHGHGPARRRTRCRRTCSAVGRHGHAARAGKEPGSSAGSVIRGRSSTMFPRDARPALDGDCFFRGNVVRPSQQTAFSAGTASGLLSSLVFPRDTLPARKLDSKFRLPRFPRKIQPARPRRCRSREKSSQLAHLSALPGAAITLRAPIDSEIFQDSQAVGPALGWPR